MHYHRTTIVQSFIQHLPTTVCYPERYHLEKKGIDKYEKKDVDMGSTMVK